MASPLPKTNAPASAKYHAMLHSVPAEAAAPNPVIDQAGHDHPTGSDKALMADAARPHLGGALMNKESTPLPKNNHTISDSVQAVTTALTMNRAQSRRSLLSVILPNFHTLRPMIAMTAAPMP